MVTIFIDGACLGNPGPGGWAAILRWHDREYTLSGAASMTTNNRMELRAAIAALQALPQPSRVELYTDSRYLQQGISQWISTWQRQGWRTSRRRPVKNRDLWQALLKAMAPHEVRWHWLRGHAGHPDNVRADALARRAAQEQAATARSDLETFSDDRLILSDCDHDG